MLRLASLLCLLLAFAMHAAAQPDAPAPAGEQPVSAAEEARGSIEALEASLDAGETRISNWQIEAASEEADYDDLAEDLRLFRLDLRTWSDEAAVLARTTAETLAARLAATDTDGEPADPAAAELLEELASDIAEAQVRIVELGSRADALLADVRARRLDSLQVELSAQASELADRSVSLRTSLAAADSDLDGLSDDVRQLRAETRDLSASLDALIAQLRQEIEILGPNEAGVVPDAGALELVQSRLGAFLVLKRRADSLAPEVEGILSDIAVIRRNRLISEISRRDDPTRALDVWPQALRQVGERLGDFASYLSGRSGLPGQGWNVLAILASLVLSLALLMPIRGYLNDYARELLRKRTPTPLSRAIGLTLRAVLRFISGVVSIALVYYTMRATGLVPDTAAGFAQAIALALGGVVVVEAFAASMFAPRLEDWRVIPVSNATALFAQRLLTASAAAFALNYVLSATFGLAGADGSLLKAGQNLTTFILAAIVFISGDRSRWTLLEARAGEVSKTTLRGLSVVLRLTRPVAIAGLAVWLLGYQNLAFFTLTRIVMLSMLVTVVWITRDTFQSLLLDIDRRFNQPDDDRKDETEATTLGFWGGVVADALLVLGVVPVALFIFGQSPSEIRGIMSDAFDGFNVGGLRISLSDIFGGGFAFASVLVFTRFVQVLLDRRLFSGARADLGFRNSLRTLTGYIGVVLAIISTITIIGLDLSNLAIVAGALSVGIGFGLQSIVNNFVSGLILLFERPIKVGDWIVASSGEGIVKRINIRSTEIETFENASIIVPNSELVSSSVQNWTLKDKRRRISINVGVHYKSDPSQVRDVLLDVARKARFVATYPPPFVLFNGFGDSSLDFELRVHISHIDHRFLVQNEVRFGIFAAFEEAGIEIPYPQRDLHIKGPGSEALGIGLSRRRAFDGAPATRATSLRRLRKRKKRSGPD